jgi:hypothetical protein
MAQVVFNHMGGKPPFFDDTCYGYWKEKDKDVSWFNQCLWWRCPLAKVLG